MVGPILLGSLFAGVSVAHPHHDEGAMAETALMTWDYAQPLRFGMQTDVVLPEMLWFASGYNKQARVREFSLGLVTECKLQTMTRKRSEIACVLTDVGIKAMSLPQEKGLLEPILGELDARLTGITVQLQIRSDGSLKNIDIDGLDRRNRRFGRINENMRLVLTRVFAGLDLPLPKQSAESGWLQHHSWLVSAPSVTGTAGVAEIVHKVIGRDGDRAFVASAGRGTVSPNDGVNIYRMRVESETTLDTATGQLVERNWTMAGHPTPSSLISQGFEGYPYLQRGRIVALDAEDEWDVGMTAEIPATNNGMSALQQQFMGPGL
ncbi:MAG: hypothetical protein AAGA48_23230 [Myxococcota bacterium]